MKRPKEKQKPPLRKLSNHNELQNLPRGFCACCLSIAYQAKGKSHIFFVNGSMAFSVRLRNQQVNRADASADKSAFAINKLIEQMLRRTNPPSQSTSYRAGASADKSAFAINKL
jgi:hypothetical protein